MDHDNQTSTLTQNDTKHDQIREKNLMSLDNSINDMQLASIRSITTRKTREFLDDENPSIDKHTYNVLDSLIQKSPGAARLYIFLKSCMTARSSAIMCTQTILARELNVSSRTIHNWLKRIESEGGFVRVQFSGNIYAYVVEPKRALKTYNKDRPFLECVLFRDDGACACRPWMKYSEDAMKSLVAMSKAR